MPTAGGTTPGGGGKPGGGRETSGSGIKLAGLGGDLAPCDDLLTGDPDFALSVGDGVLKGDAFSSLGWPGGSIPGTGGSVPGACRLES